MKYNGKFILNSLAKLSIHARVKEYVLVSTFHYPELSITTSTWFSGWGVDELNT